MTRAIFVALALTASAASLKASPWPEFPQHPDPVTAQDVKDYWFHALPRPEKPRPLDPFYKSKIKDYQYDISTGRSLIRRLLAGYFDHEAQLTALRHNLLLYQAGDLASQTSDTEASIALLLAQGPPQTTTTEFTSRLGRSSGLRLARLEPSYGLRPPNRSRSTPTASPSPSPDSPSAAEPEIIYVELSDDSQDADPCPPQQARPPHRPPHRPRPPLDEKPFPQIPDPPSPQASPPPQPPASRPAPSSPPTSFFERSRRSSR